MSDNPTPRKRAEETLSPEVRQGKSTQAYKAVAVKRSKKTIEEEEIGTSI
jgi:hypothetical protein